MAQDGVKAVRYLRLGAAQGEIMSLHDLGKLMITGNAWTGENYTEGWSFINRAAQAGYGEALLLLAQAKLHGSNGQAKNLPEAAGFMKRAADAGDIQGMFAWGQMLYNAMGTTENKPEALKYYRLAANGGDGLAQHEMALTYYFGDIGIPKNLVEAARWARMAAESREATGQLLYGKLLWAGEGVAQDRTQAVRYYKMAADQGNETAISDLKDPEVAAILRTLRN